MIISKMQEHHIVQLAALEALCFVHPWSEHSLRQELGKGIFLVAEQEGVIVGYVGCQTVLDEGYITNVAVLPTYRKQGIGRALLTELAAIAKEQALCFVTLEVRQSNQAAQRLYKAMGYIEVGMRKRFYTQPTEDAVLMTWNI